MTSKKITFDYNGGEYTQDLKISGTNLPWRYECNDNWILVTTAATSITVSVRPIYDFETRTGVVKIYDKYNNELDFIVEQTGYYDLSIEMPTDVVLYQNYYDENNSYDVYVTVYGGPLQYVDCKELELYTQKVWDNSDMYNDFMIRIPQTVSGEFTIKHSDCEKFEEFCKEHEMEYPKDQLEKKLNIVQVSTDDAIGEMVIEVNGEEYTNKSDIFEIEVSYNKPVEINIISTKFVIVESKTKYRIVRNSDIVVPVTPNWLDAKYKSRKILLQCNEKNNFGDRYSEIMLQNKDNTRQTIRIQIKQKSGN
jgi:hypothetical protein